ncbi:hypothetical protein RN001_011429 [Aquatica leii]|uniref:Uncharacterized protein n=1 Tax=Aquatica leii TaxID=1421715 RepID=A0AAN7P2B2_9COLE|nr:hypothetical protein RN001_011429 [Aquatica leii]
MKSFLVLLIISVSSAIEFNSETHKKWEKIVEPHVEECMKETNVDSDVVGVFHQQFYFSNNKNFQCYMKCIAEKLHFIDAHGKINVDALKDSDDKEATEVAEVCSKSTTKTDPCEIAFEFAMCFMGKLTELHRKQ